MKFKITIFVIVASFIFYGTAFAAQSAQGPSSTKIGLINMQKALFESKAGKEARGAFEKELETKRATLQVKEKEVQDLENDLKNNSAKLKADARKAKEANFEKELKELRRLRQDLSDELKKRDSELTTKLVKEILDIAKKVGEEGKYTVIMQGGPAVIYGDKDADITDEVIKKYDSQYQRK